jgi:hypothetical protein
VDTADLKARIKAAVVGTVGARLWPNGLGFDLRGTQYVLRMDGSWVASRHDGYAVKYGEGNTPQAAKLAAGIGRDKHTRSRPL